MTENQRKVYEILESSGEWMSTEDIANKEGFEKYAPVTSSLISLVKSGYVERKTQKLLNGNTMGFYRLIKKYESKKWFVEQVNRFGHTVKMLPFLSKEEALSYINLKKSEEHGIPIELNYRLYEAQEVGEY